MVRKNNRAETAAISRSLISYTNPLSNTSEQYRNIRTIIQFMSQNHKLHSIMVTSPGFGEGKSTASVNLAISMAQRGDKVLLIDAVLRKPTLNTTFNLPNTVGLTNVLTGHAAVEDAVQKTGIGELEVLVSGPVRTQWTELLGSRMIKQMLQTLKGKYDIVLFDCPPVLESSDTMIIAHECDGSILVVKSGTTRREKADEAKKALELAKLKIIGVIINKKRYRKISG